MIYAALVLGLLTGFHCLGMCGPIAFLLPVDKNNKLKGLIESSLYHIGRILTYASLGLVFGSFGRGLFMAGFQQRISLLAGIFMLFVALIGFRTGRLDRLISKWMHKPLSNLRSALGRRLKERKKSTLFAMGMLNGLLPCGMVYVALFGAIGLANPLQGALYMALFGLGTVPLMTSAIFLGQFLKQGLGRKVQMAFPIFAIGIGVLFILRGLGLGIPYVSPKDVKLQVSNKAGDCAVPIDSVHETKFKEDTKKVARPYQTN